MELTAAQALRKARGLIENPAAWGQGPSWDRPSTYCALDAIERAAFGNFDAIERAAFGNFDAMVAAEDVLCTAVGRSVVLWNDAPNRTHSDVLVGFDRAIALAEAS